jgi:hypothetical protein
MVKVLRTIHRGRRRLLVGVAAGGKYVAGPGGWAAALVVDLRDVDGSAYGVRLGWGWDRDRPGRPWLRAGVKSGLRPDPGTARNAAALSLAGWFAVVTRDTPAEAGPL